MTLPKLTRTRSVIKTRQDALECLNGVLDFIRRNESRLSLFVAQDLEESVALLIEDARNGDNRIQFGSRTPARTR